MATISEWTWYSNGWVDGVVDDKSTIDKDDTIHIRPYGWKNNLIGHDSMLLGNISVPGHFVFRPKNIQPGNIVNDVKGNEYYIRDDIAYQDVRALK